ncbi:unnamed protein product [Effrenium voratum]|nr:unnamed protein product [Effrenium voratum]
MGSSARALLSLISAHHLRVSAEVSAGALQAEEAEASDCYAIETASRCCGSGCGWCYREPDQRGICVSWLLWSDTRCHEDAYPGECPAGVPPKDLLRVHEADGSQARFDVFLRSVALHPTPAAGIGCLYERVILSRAPDQFRLRLGLWEELRSSVQSGRFASWSPLLVANRGLVDGAHRMAAALYLGRKVYIQWAPEGGIVIESEYFDGSPFFQHWEMDTLRRMYQGFMQGSSTSLRQFLQTWDESESHESGAASDCGQVIRIPLVLWPTLEPQFETAVSAMRETMKRYKMGAVDEVADYHFGASFPEMVRAMYASDDIAAEKIEFKLRGMRESLGSDELLNGTTRVVWLLLPSRDTFAKSNGKLAHKGLSEIKESLRGRFKTEVKNYVFDIICHGADNQEQADFIAQILAHWPPQFILGGAFESLRRLSNPSPTVCQFKEEEEGGFKAYDLFEALEQWEVPLSEVLVVGSGTFAMLPSKETGQCLPSNRDVDLVLSEEARARLGDRELSQKVEAKPHGFPDHYSHYFHRRGTACNITRAELLQDRGRWTLLRRFPAAGAAGAASDAAEVAHTLRVWRPELHFASLCFRHNERDVKLLHRINAEELLSQAMLRKLPCDVPMEYCLSL